MDRSRVGWSAVASFGWVRRGLSGAALALWLLAAGSDRAEAQVKPRFVISVDTSGSMLWDLSNNTTYGDGVGRLAIGGDPPALVRDGVFYGCRTTAGLDRNCDGWPNDSKLAIAKDAIRKMVLGFGDVEWSLARFHQINQTTTANYTGSSNQCDNQSYGNPQCNTGSTATGCVGAIPDACEPAKGTNLSLRNRVSGDFNGTINYFATSLSSCAGYTSGDLLVGFPGSGSFSSLDNRPAILKWMDNVETVFDSATTVGNFCNHATTGDCELRAIGRTPLGSLIQTSGNYATTTRTSDSNAACRQYSIILVTDGAESCSTNPNQRAYELAFPTQAMSGTCNPAQIPQVTPQIRTYVVGISIVSGEQSSLNAIAACGGSGNAYFANTESALSAALADIVGRSIPVEICNGKDDDCDTKIDEGIPTGHSGSDAQPDALFCDGEARRSGTQNAQVALLPGYPNLLQTTPLSASVVCGRVDDTCSHARFDDDCDGKLDEDEPANNLTPCGTCPGANDVCDGADNDCDGVTDEIASSGRPFSACPTPCTRNVPCGSGIGTCMAGLFMCNAGVLDTSTCVGRVGPTDEICDELDNDCNGIVDDPAMLARTCNTPWGTTGICIPGTQFCAKPSMGESADPDGYHVDAQGKPVCAGAVPPEDREICDVLDHDCDGDPFTCTQSSCMVGPQPAQVGDPCGQGVGSCRGTLECDETANPPALVCNAPGGSPEICDDLDNDCDGKVDEELGSGGPCGSSVGECRPGTLMCDPSGAQVCTGATTPGEEVCDALDNDCDGKVDEGLALGEACGSDEGACVAGKNMCSNGRTVCSGEVGPQLETCDCADNDCDGKMDEDTGDSPVCPGGSVCTMCQCALPCTSAVEFIPACPQGKAPVNDAKGCYCVGERCNDTSCSRQTIKLEGETQCEPNNSLLGACGCKNNVCTFLCSGVQCSGGLVCDPTDGRCRQSSCLLPQFACASNQRCALVDQVFQCMDDPCAFQTCGDDQACRDGTCVNSCARVECPTGQRCYDGECVQDRCSGVNCAAGSVCDPATGDCLNEGSCARTGCPDGNTCDPVGGTCSEDVCLRTVCPIAERCNSLTGQCELRCDRDQLFCNNRCINPASNRMFCGATGNCQGDNIGEACGTGLVCSESACSTSCASGLVNCGGGCIAPATDDQHCGASDDCSGDNAGQACTGSTRCVQGRCVGADAGTKPETSGGKRIVAAGGGGCACSVGPGGAPAGDAAPSRLAFGLLCSGLIGLCLRRRLRLRGARWRAWFAAALALLCSGCKLNTFCLDCREDAAGQPMDSSVSHPDDTGIGRDSQVAPLDGSIEPDTGGSDANATRPDACTTLELCNGLDDDCDGTVDEDADPVASNVDIDKDARHCGGCGKACAIVHAFNRCVAAKCQIDRSQGEDGCDIGYVDLDKNEANGCEYRCAKTATDDSACNQVDNDCDGRIDEDVDLNTSPDNCGNCGLRCVFANAAEAARCVDKQCVLDNTKCDSGFIDADAKPATGCEYRCPVQPTSEETCNSLDDDCDGHVDENIAPEADPRIAMDCGTTEGECELGSTVCFQGAPLCMGGVAPSPETCDSKDNDCDTKTDEGFDRQTDLGNCGTCGNKCLIDANVSNGHATLVCQAGACKVGACIGNFADTNGDYHDGCETACTITGDEVCDGTDNDCNGMIDDMVSTPPVVCVSRETGVCAANMPTLTALRDNGPVCSNATLSCDPSRANIDHYENPETSCDTLDNDCDGRVDEMLPAVGQACTLGHGACTTSGVNVCDSQESTGYRCNAAMPSSGTPETCDGLDNNCNSVVDDFSPPTASNSITGFSLVDLGASNGNVLIMAYEASRGDATNSDAGHRSGKPCSAANKLPWANVTWGEADAACCALNANGECDGGGQGWRLCDASTWASACKGPTGVCTWAYSANCAHDPRMSGFQSTCLGTETSVTCPSGVSQCATVTGSGNFASCRAALSGGNVFDMSGNIKEWTRTSQGANIYELRGGSFNNLENGRACVFNFTVGTTSFRFPNTGFRCCYYP